MEPYVPPSGAGFEPYVKTTKASDDDKKETDDEENVAIAVKEEEESKQEEAAGDDDDDDAKNKGDASGIPVIEEVRNRATNFRMRRRDLSPEQVRNQLIIGAIVTFVVLVIGITLLASSLKKVKEVEVGLKYSKYRKHLVDAAKSGGLFVGPPGFKFVKFPSTYINEDLANTCVSRDGLRVYYECSFQYQMTEENLYPAVIKYRDFYKWAEVVEAAGRSAIQHTCSDFTIASFQNQRGVIQSRMLDNLRLKLEGNPNSDEEQDIGVYAVAISVQLRFLQLPSEYQNAVAEKQSAEEDIVLARNQRRQETTKATTELLAAKEEARKILETATTEAEIMITEAKLKAEETLFAFEQEALSIVKAKSSLNLTTAGVLAYTENMLIAQTPRLRVSAGEPAKLSRKDEL